MDGVVKEHQFSSIELDGGGRGRFVEIHVLVTPEPDIDARCRSHDDRSRRGAPTFWLTIDSPRIDVKAAAWIP